MWVFYGTTHIQAQVFMGDTGSLSLGGIIAVVNFFNKKELLLPILWGYFL